MTSRKAQKRAARGAAWLDSQLGTRWTRRIRRPLDLNSNTLCVLGQVYGDWLAAPLPPMSAVKEVLWLFRHGFMTVTGDRLRANEKVAAAWRAEIDERSARPVVLKWERERVNA